MTNRKRLHPDERKNEIILAALRVAKRPGGWHELTRTNVAQEAGCCDSLVSVYFGTIPNFKRDVMRAAIAVRELSVIAQGLVSGDKHARKAPADLKAQALNSLRD